MRRMPPSILCIACSLAMTSACNFQASTSSGQPPSSGKPAASDIEGKPAASAGKPVDPEGKPVPTEPADEPQPGGDESDEPGHRAPVDDPAVRAKADAAGVSCSVSDKACKRSARGAGEACPDERVAELEALCAEALAPLAASDADAFAAQLTRGVRLRHGKKAVVGIDPVTKSIADAGGPRPFFGLDAKADLTATVTEDCARCRRSYVGIDLETPTGTATITVEGGDIPKISALTLPARATK